MEIPITENNPNTPTEPPIFYSNGREEIILLEPTYVYNQGMIYKPGQVDVLPEFDLITEPIAPSEPTIEDLINELKASPSYTEIFNLLSSAAFIKMGVDDINKICYCVDSQTIEVQLKMIEVETEKLREIVGDISTLEYELHVGRLNDLTLIKEKSNEVTHEIQLLKRITGGYLRYQYLVENTQILKSELSSRFEREKGLEISPKKTRYDIIFKLARQNTLAENILATRLAASTLKEMELKVMVEADIKRSRLANVLLKTRLFLRERFNEYLENKARKRIEN